jgi:hypothetical protein
MKEAARMLVERDRLHVELLDQEAKHISALHLSAQAGRLVQKDRDTLRAALIAAMEIVQKERVRIAYNAKGSPPAIELGYLDILRRLDAVIAQADAALGSER